MEQRARSIYRQVRLTITEEKGGRVTARVMVKPVDADWSMRDTVWQGGILITGPTTHWSELLHFAAEDVLAQRLFPE